MFVQLCGLNCKKQQHLVVVLITHTMSYFVGHIGVHSSLLWICPVRELMCESLWFIQSSF